MECEWRRLRSASEGASARVQLALSVVIVAHPVRPCTGDEQDGRVRRPITSVDGAAPPRLAALYFVWTHRPVVGSVGPGAAVGRTCITLSLKNVTFCVT